jgi:hypothetical protein
MLRPWVANRVLMTLQFITVHDRVEFGGKNDSLCGQTATIIAGYSEFLNSKIPTAAANEGARCNLG